MDEQFFLYNDLLYKSGTPFLDEKNRAFKYGDGLFETIRVYRGRIINSRFHFARFFKGLSLLKLSFPETFSESFLIQKINILLGKNNIPGHARVRLMAFRSEGDLSGTRPGSLHYLVEASQADEPVKLYQEGLKVDLFEDTRKSCDKFSNVKTNNYLSNVMAMIYAAENHLDECILLNSYGRICESAISNLFIIKNRKVSTPSLAEGCVEGVVRSWLINHLLAINMEVKEKEIHIEEVLEADELFLTNSIRLIRWVKKFGHKEYTCNQTKQIAEFVFRNMIGKVET